MLTEARTRIGVVRSVLRLVLTAAMVFVGVLHFVRPEPFVAIVPKALPAPLALVLVSGAAEIAGGLGLLVPRTRRAASIGLVALYLAVLPANVNMAMNDVALDGKHLPPVALWLRLPFQLVFIGWALWVGRDGPERGAPIPRA